MARRQNRANNIGMRSVSGPARPYGKCPICGREKPMHWITRVDYRCYDCMKGRKVKDAIPPPEKSIGTEPIVASASGDVYDESQPFFEPSTVKMQKEKWQRRGLKKKKSK